RISAISTCHLCTTRMRSPIYFLDQCAATSASYSLSLRDALPILRGLMVTVCPSQFATRRTLFHVLVGCGLLMLKVSRLKLPERRSEERFSRNAEADLVCRLLLENTNSDHGDALEPADRQHSSRLR